MLQRKLRTENPYAYRASVRVLHCAFLLQPTYRVDKRKSQTEVLLGSLNWLISRSLSEAEVLPSSPEKEIKDIFKSSVCLGASHQNKTISQTLSFGTGSQPILALPQAMHSRTSMGPLCTSNLPSQAGAMQPARLGFVQLKDKQNITQAWQGQDWECYNTPSPLRLHIRQNRQQARAAGTKASHAGSLRNNKKAKL